MKKLLLPLLIAAGLIGSASADTFGTGANQFTIDFTTIGNPGNAADTTGYGSVGYTYRIGTYTISQNQIDAATASGLQNVTAGAWSGDQPAANVSWYEAMAFVNWLNTSSGHQAAYNISNFNGSWSVDLWHSWDSGYNQSNPLRNSRAVYVLPSTDEWYKAAYGKNDGNGYFLYPTATDAPPGIVSSGTNPQTAVYNLHNSVPGPASVYQAGGLSSYGTMGQGGNIYQFMESAAYGLNSFDISISRDARGGSWYSAEYYYPGSATVMSSAYSYNLPNNQGQDFIGFRVASVVPEPATYALFGIGAFGLMMVLRRKKTV